MALQYWVGGFFIDLSRNQITQNKQSQTIAPKALAVLTYLAENQGKVMSHDALLDKVWQDTAVSPNTLQKSIAQLRKALGDNGNVYIKTHAKQGYSLECDVRWQDNLNPTVADSVSSNTASISSQTDISSAESNHQVETSRANFKRIAIVAGLAILTFIGYQNFVPKPSSQIVVEQLRLLTATDDKEFDASYSPDGEYIVFHRYLDKQCVNKIWAKNINTQEEIQLTKDWGEYGRHSFSEDGKKMVFLATEPCDQPVRQRNCYDLVSLDFEKALKSPQQPNVMLQCKNSLVKKPIWLNDDKIVLMKRHANRWKLISYSIDDNQSSELYDLKDGNLIDFAYSTKRDLIAVTSIHHGGKHHIDMLNSDGKVLSSHAIEKPSEIPEYRLIAANFSPSHEQLIFSTGKQLFTLSFDGKIAKISSPFSESMGLPEFHPDGKKLLMIKGPYDSDIIKLSFDQLDEITELTQTNQPHNYSSLERTNVGEDHALFQPGGELIAFWSERSGESQVWIRDTNGPKQLTRFPMDTYIQGFDWAADGKSLLVAANNDLIQVDLDSNQNNIALEYPVVRLYQWDSKNNTALLAVSISGKTKVVEYDFNHSEINELNDRDILWALKSQDGRLIYKDFLSHFWQPGPVEDQQIKALDDQRSKSKSFVVNGSVLYGVNRKNQLWSYDLDSDSFKVLAEFDKSIDHVTDVNQTHILLAIQVAAKKEVVELTLSE